LFTWCLGTRRFSDYISFRLLFMVIIGGLGSILGGFLRRIHHDIADCFEPGTCQPWYYSVEVSRRRYPMPN
jgi:hypothetical protein